MGISIGHLAVVLLVVVLLFGTSKLRTIGSDLGGAIKGFRDAMNDDSKGTTAITPDENDKPNPKA